MLAEAEITALVLCGGKATRMGGVEKPLQPIVHAGLKAPMIDHVLATLPKNSPLLISANRSEAIYGTRAAVIKDIEKSGSGPLAGVLSGLSHMNTPWLLVCPGDMPFLPIKWHWPLRSVVDHSSDIDCAVIHDGQRLQPLLCLIHVSRLENLRLYLKTGEFSAHKWLDSIGFARVDRKEQGPFLNINTAVELDNPNL